MQNHHIPDCEDPNAAISVEDHKNSDFRVGDRVDPGGVKLAREILTDADN